jgi:HEAT repeat protein
VLTISAVAFAGTLGRADPAKTTRQLLLAMVNAQFDSKTLAPLFDVGDERINDLIAALNDPDQHIRYAAVVVLKYLGNPKGIEALNNKCRNQSGCEFFLDVFPIPLSDFDYAAIRGMSQVPLSRWNAVPESCAYALALDGSERSEKLLAQWLKSSKSEDSRYYLDAIASSIRDHAAQKTFAARPSLVDAVVANAFFLQPADRAVTKAHLLALSSAGNKALIEVHVNHGVTAERWYHVVVVKQGQQWRLFSVHLLKQG